MSERAAFYISALLVGWLALWTSLFLIASRINYVQVFIFPEDLPYLITSLQSLSPLRYGLDLLSALGGVALFTWAAFALGLLVLRYLPLNLTGYLETFTLGQILLSVVFLTLIHLFPITPLLTISVGITGLALGVPHWLRIGASLSQALKQAWNAWPPLTRWEKGALVLILFVLGVATWLSAARLGYDAASEYFSNAKAMALSGEPINLYPSDRYLVSSFHSMILFTVIIQFFGDQAARLLSWVNGLVILLAGLEIGRKAGLSRRARLLFLIFALTSTFFLDLLGEGKVELISTAPIMVGLNTFWDWLERPNPKRAALCGVFWGFALIARPYNLFLIPLFVGLYLGLTLWKAPNRGEEVHLWLRNGLPVIAIPILGLVLFHLGQNALWLGDPLQPFHGGNPLDGRQWQWQFDPSLLPWLRLLYPLVLTFMNTPQSLGNLTPLGVGFLPLVLLPPIRRHVVLPPRLARLSLAALLTLLGYVLAFFTVVEIRYVMFLWLLLFLPLASLAESAQSYATHLLSPVVRLLPLLLLLALGLRCGVIALATWSPVDSQGQATCTWHRLCVFFQPLNRVAAPGERVLVLHAYRYYLRPDLLLCSSRPEEYATLMPLAQADPQAFWVEAYRLGFRYLTYETKFALFHSRLGAPPPPAEAPPWLRVTLIANDGLHAIYRLSAQNSPQPPSRTCRLNERGVWEVTER